MKQFIVCSLLFFHFSGICQLKLFNESLTSKDSAVVYIGITNHLKIDGQQDLSKFKFTSTNSEISIVGNYISLQSDRRGVDTIRIYSNKKLVSTNIIRVDRINNPVAQFAFTADTVIAQNRILANPVLSVNYPNALLNLNIRVIGFQCSIQKANGGRFIYSDELHGNRLTNSILKLIPTLSSGDKLVFDDIKAIANENDTRKLPSFTITIK